MRAVYVAFGLALSAAPAAAQTVTGDCLWANVSAGARDKMIVAYADGGRKALDRVPHGIGFQEASICAGVTPETKAGAEKLGFITGALMSVVPLERASQAALAERGISSRALDQAWAGLGPRKRAMLRTTAEAIEKKRPVDEAAFASAIVDASELAGWEPREGDASPMTLMSDYFLSRAIREGLEAR